MHAVELADLASTFVSGTPTQYALKLLPAGSAPQDYWLTTRYRQENWMRQLSLHRDAIGRPGLSRRMRNWSAIFPTLQEILLAEPLSRVLAYHAAVLEMRGMDRDFGPLANSALAAQIEARNRCLHLIVFGQGLPVEDAVRLNRLRRALERYTDELLVCLPSIDTSGLFSFEGFQLAARQAQMGPQLKQTQWTTLQSLCSAESLWHAVRHDLDWRSANARLNYQLSQHVLRFTSSSSFDSFGTPHTTFFGQLTLLSPEASTTADPPLHPLFQQGVSGTKLTGLGLDKRLGLKSIPRRLQGD